MIISMLGYLLTKDKLKETARMGLAYGSIFMSIAMILDAALGLPLSSISNVGGSIGFNYLFGFGINSPSTLAVSLAFSLLLIFNGLVFSTFLRSKGNMTGSRSK
jgi:nitrate/nitrite transporter NarK